VPFASLRSKSGAKANSEKQERIVKWLSASQAAQRVNEPNLGEIIRRMARRYGERKPGRAARASARIKIK